MTPRRLEVWLVRLAIGRSSDLRPCILIEEPKDKQVYVVALSGNRDLFRSGLDFKIPAEHANFKASGF